jgi:hypothetical protein
VIDDCDCRGDGAVNKKGRRHARQVDSRIREAKHLVEGPFGHYIHFARSMSMSCNVAQHGTGDLHEVTGSGV